MKSYSSVSEFSRLGCVILHSWNCPAPCACKGNDTRMLLLRLHLGAYLWKERPS